MTRDTGDKLIAPGAGWDCDPRLPDINDRLAPPETRLEYLDGVEIFAAPADEPHATEHFDLVYVLGAHTQKGYRGAVDMLTRTGEASDIAPDASIFPEDPDVRTGGRRLEEIAFEVTSEQRLAVPTEKARKLIERGVRRVFCILVKQQRVMEWSRDTDGWMPLPGDFVIEDRVLVRPLPIQTLLDGAVREDAVARALLARHVPALEEAIREREARGELHGSIVTLRAAVCAAFRARKMELSPAQRERIDSCEDPKALTRWLEQAVIAPSPKDVLGDR